jgi:hypothetical protein
MDAMDETDEAVAGIVPKSKKKTPKKKPKTAAQRRAMVQEFEVPTRPLCAGRDKDDKTVVCVYRQPISDVSTKSRLYLREDCIEWLLAYAAAEFASQGVEPTSPAPTPHKAGNCAAVADLYLDYDYNVKGWEGKFLAGPCVGTKKRMSIYDLNAEVWGLLKAKSAVAEGCYLSKATLLEKKHAVKEYMTMWCAAITRNESADFESLIRCKDPLAGSPQRGEEIDLEDHNHTAVATEGVCLEAAVADNLVTTLFWDQEEVPESEAIA